MPDRRYPIGRFEPRSVPLSAEERAALISGIEHFPSLLRAKVEALSTTELAKSYRPGGWTGYQVVHHLADSHVNAYIRLKWAITEDRPIIKPYYQNEWADTVDSRQPDVENSLTLLQAIHHRWGILWRSLNAEDFRRELIHPEEGTLTVDILLQLYSWHGQHHLGHLNLLSTSD